jgi:outer membrane protein
MQDTFLDIGRILGRLVAAAIAIAVASPIPGLAQTLEQALGQAYRNNETLNAERASLRAIDEEVPQALSDYRPESTRQQTSAGAIWTRKEPTGYGKRQQRLRGVSA